MRNNHFNFDGVIKMLSKYIVSVQNDINEQMTFEFKEIHDALTLYRTAKHDESVTYLTVDCVEYDENNPDKFINGWTIRVYERV